MRMKENEVSEEKEEKKEDKEEKEKKEKRNVLDVIKEGVQKTHRRRWFMLWYIHTYKVVITACLSVCYNVR